MEYIIQILVNFHPFKWMRKNAAIGTEIFFTFQFTDFSTEKPLSLSSPRRMSLGHDLALVWTLGAPICKGHNRNGKQLPICIVCNIARPNRWTSDSYNLSGRTDDKRPRLNSIVQVFTQLMLVFLPDIVTAIVNTLR